MFRHHQPLRRWAARVLLVWLFGMGMNMANACLPSDRDEPVVPADRLHAVSAHAHHYSEPPLLHQAAEAQQSELGGEGLADPDGLARTNCQDFCDQAMATIPPLKSALDDAQALPVVDTSPVLYLPAQARTSPMRWVVHRAGEPARSIPIAFCRLVR